MPHKEVDYSKTVIYKMVCNDLSVSDCYVGHTTYFTKRKSHHKSDCTSINSKGYNYKVYKVIRDSGGWQNWSMILVERYPCNNRLEALQRERYWCEQLCANLNSNVPSRLPKEWSEQYYKENEVKIKEYANQYYKENTETILNKFKRYRIKNISKIKHNQSTVINCQCGCTYTKSNKLRHEKSTKHQEYQKNRLYYKIKQGLDMIKKLDTHFTKKK